MDYYKISQKMTPINTNDMFSARNANNCTNPCCFFCIINEPEEPIRRAKILSLFQNMDWLDNEMIVVVVSGVWNLAMTRPDEPELPSLGVFECMARLIQRGTYDKEWLRRGQNVYIPYYAAHIIGSYTMNRRDFAEMAVESGVIAPLMELLRGKMSWVEKRVAVRALGHLASFESSSTALLEFENEVIQLAMNVACTCREEVYNTFIGIEDRDGRSKYQCDLLTRGVGGVEIENRKAEEWASQLQIWSIHLLNCFAYKGRCLNLICKPYFLKNLCGMWGGLVNDKSPGGFGLIRILCYSQYGRKQIANSEQVLHSLGNLCRSSDDWQYIGIDCFLLLLKDQETRLKVMQISTIFLADLIELKSLNGRSNLGDSIIKALIFDYQKTKSKLNKIAQKSLQEIWVMQERNNQEKTLTEDEIEHRKTLVNLLKTQGNQCFREGNIQEAELNYTKALELCPLKLRKERLVLYSNRSKCRLLVRDAEGVIRDTSRALCLTKPTNLHGKSLWRRAQAYDMKGTAKECLMDCIMLINCSIRLDQSMYVKIPFHVARLICKQMDQIGKFDGKSDESEDDEMMMMMMMRGRERKDIMFGSAGVAAVLDESLIKGATGKNRFASALTI